MSRLQIILDSALGFFIALVIAGLLAWGIATLVSTTSKTNEVVSFISNSLKSQEQAVQSPAPSK